MALNSSGPISLAGTVAGQSIELELLGNGSTQISLNDAAVRTLAGVPSGAITMPTNFYGKSNTLIVPVTGNQVNMNLRTYALSNGWDGTSKFQLQVNSGVYIYSTSTATPAITVTGSWPNGVEIVNTGYIMGMGGAGGNGPGGAGGAGGTAIFLGTNLTLVNNSYIGGGGGGGGGGQNNSGGASGGGGGAGGANGGNSQNYGSPGGSGGAAGGGPGSAGNNGTGFNQSGGGGGRIMPGAGGAAGGSNGGGAGGGGGSAWSTSPGSGGSAGNPGNIGSNPSNSPAGSGGGGWGAAGSRAGGGGAGGAGGKAIALNGYTVSTSGSGTIYGAVS